jgi:DNA-binding CsgD family transcriptional regulator
MTRRSLPGLEAGSNSNPARGRGTDLPPTAAPSPTTKEDQRSHVSTTGFILVDSAQKPIAFNAEAVQILCHPDKPSSTMDLNAFLAGRIRSRLLSRPSSDHRSPGVTAFQSGRRLYFCRRFDLTSTSNGSTPAAIGLLLERSSSESMSMAEIVKQFSLSPREQQAVEYLLMGLTSKEIADRMKISANTVKAFLRLVMVKMGVSTRSGIVGKIVTAKPQVYSGGSSAPSS